MPGTRFVGRNRLLDLMVSIMSRSIAVLLGVVLVVAAMILWGGPMIGLRPPQSFWLVLLLLILITAIAFYFAFRKGTR